MIIQRIKPLPITGNLVLFIQLCGCLIQTGFRLEIAYMKCDATMFETMTQYIASMRCKKAANLLKKTNLPIQEISSYVGYSDNNYFVKVFKKNYDMTPTEFRKAT